MTSPTGNRSRAGFTFLEVMVTLVILSSGIVFIYKTFFLCVDYLSRLAGRLQASELIDERIADLGRLYHQNQSLSFDHGTLTVMREINHKPVEFSYQIQISPVPGFDGLAHLDLGISWLWSGHLNHLHREALFTL